VNRFDLLQLYLRLGLTPIPLKPCSKEPLVRWGNGWNPSTEELQRWAAQAGLIWGIRGGPELAALDFDSADSFHSFVQVHPQANSWPTIRTGRGYHLWVKLKKPIAKVARELEEEGWHILRKSEIDEKGELRRWLQS
jgi:hypothetical protein